MIRCQRTQSLAFLEAEWIPVLANCTPASIPLSEVVRGCPRGLLQSLGGWSDALRARWWSCLESERATWPKKWSRLVLMILETWGAASSLHAWTVTKTLVRWLDTFDTWSVRKILPMPCTRHITTGRPPVSLIPGSWLHFFRHNGTCGFQAGSPLSH